MSFHLCAVSFVTDVEDLLVIMVKRDCAIPGVAQDQQEEASKSKISCHVLQAPNVCVYNCICSLTLTSFNVPVGSHNGVGNRPGLQCGIS